MLVTVLFQSDLTLCFTKTSCSSDEALAVHRKQVNGVGTNWCLIAVVGCSAPELDRRHTVHELNCAWEAWERKYFSFYFLLLM